MAPGSSVFLSGGTHGCCRAEGLSRAARCPLLGQHLSSSPRGVAGCEQTDRRTEHPPERRPAPRPGAVPSRAGMLRALWASFHRSAFPGRIFSSHGWTWDVNPPPPRPVMEHGCPHMAGVPGCQPRRCHCRCPLLHFGFWGSSGRFWFNQPVGRRTAKRGWGWGGVTQSGPFPRSWIMGVQQCRRSRIRDEQRDRRLPGPDPPGLPRGTESKNNPIVRPASFPPARGGFTPLIGPRGTASLLAVFPLGPGCLLRRWGRMGAL